MSFLHTYLYLCIFVALCVLVCHIIWISNKILIDWLTERFVNSLPVRNPPCSFCWGLFHSSWVVSREHTETNTQPGAAPRMAWGTKFPKMSLSPHRDCRNDQNLQISIVSAVKICRQCLPTSLASVGDFVPQTAYRGFAHGPHWETFVPQTPGQQK